MTKTQTAKTTALITENFGFIRSKIKNVFFVDLYESIELTFKVSGILYCARIYTDGSKRLEIIEPKPENDFSKQEGWKKYEEWHLDRYGYLPGKG